MEDFVTFEIAKKLKEKGFREKCRKHYYPNSKDWFLSSCLECDNYSDYIDAPTISQVLKWLREEKKIYLEIVMVVDAEYMCDIYKINPRPIECLGSTEYFKTYEQAALAGIEYVLDNMLGK